jgi:hypothetical protein
MLCELGAEAKQLLPALDLRLITGAYAGVRAKLVPKGAANYGDFIIEEARWRKPHPTHWHRVAGSDGTISADCQMVEEMVSSRLHPPKRTTGAQNTAD